MLEGLANLPLVVPEVGCSESLSSPSTQELPSFSHTLFSPLPAPGNPSTPLQSPGPSEPGTLELQGL